MDSRYSGSREVSATLSRQLQVSKAPGRDMMERCHDPSGQKKPAKRDPAKAVFFFDLHEQGLCSAGAGGAAYRFRLLGAPARVLHPEFVRARAPGCIRGTMEWEDLRRRARTLEADIDAKLIAFNRLSVAQVVPADAACGSGRQAAAVACLPACLPACCCCLPLLPAAAACRRCLSAPARRAPRRRVSGADGGVDRRRARGPTRRGMRSCIMASPCQPRWPPSSTRTSCRSLLRAARPRRRSPVTALCSHILIGPAAQLSETNEEMGRSLREMGGSADSARLMHVLQRHRELLHEYEKECRKIKANIREQRERYAQSPCGVPRSRRGERQRSAVRPPRGGSHAAC